MQPASPVHASVQATISQGALQDNLRERQPASVRVPGLAALQDFGPIARQDNVRERQPASMR
eukprot:123793-Alexandrium_andersonii.AAC.1